MAHKTEHAGLSDRGLVRENNEDNWSADAELGLYIVSDGVGGQFAGELASKIVVETLPPLLRTRMADITDLADGEAEKRLKHVLSELSEEVYRDTHGEPGLEGMGATVVLAMVLGSKALLGHMGDSRAYLLRDGRLEQLTKDHSIVQLLIDTGEITPEEAATHPSRGRVTRSVGMEGEPLPEANVVDLLPGDRLMLCTDGLTGMLSDQEIRGILQSESESPVACRQLIDAANDAGGKDNTTALVLDISSESAACWQ